MAKEQKKIPGPLRPVVGEEWPDGLEVVGKKEQPEQANEQQRFFIVNEIFRLATCVILILLGYSLAKSETPTLSRFGDRAWWVVIGVLAGTQIGRPAFTKLLEWWHRVEKQK